MIDITTVDEAIQTLEKAIKDASEVPDPDEAAASVDKLYEKIVELEGLAEACMRGLVRRTTQPYWPEWPKAPIRLMNTVTHMGHIIENQTGG